MKAPELAMRGAVAAGIAIALVAASDMAAGWTAHDVQRHYSPLGEVPDPKVLTITLVVSALLFAGWMAAAGRTSARGHRGRSLALAVVALLGSAGFAVLGTTAYEFGGYVLLPAWRVLLWVLPVAACVATTLLVSARSARPVQG